MRRQALTMVFACVVSGMVGGLVVVAYTAAAETYHLPGSSYYEDVAPDSPHNDDIGYCVEAGIARGYSATEFGPTWEVGREQMASFEVRDFTAGMVFALRLAPHLHQNFWHISGGTACYPEHDPPLTTEEKLARAAAERELLQWAAGLVRTQAIARPGDVIDAPIIYEEIALMLEASGH